MDYGMCNTVHVMQVEDQRSHMTTSSSISDSLQLMCEIVRYFSNEII